MSIFGSTGNSMWTGRHLLDWRRLLALAPEEASFGVRGFRADNSATQEALETIGRFFIVGYNSAVLTGSLSAVIGEIGGVPAQYRGFAAEGAAMGAAISDAIPFQTPLFRKLITFFDNDFTYLVHVGAGWAMARVPWRKQHILDALDPIHRWLAFDGLGFHDAYFKPKTLTGWRRKQSGYAARAYDQGVGRALWFASGGSVIWSAERIRYFATERHGDLFAGLGLAIAYAGPVSRECIKDAFQLAGSERANLVQGIAFACEARARASFVPAHTRVAAQTIGFEVSTLATLVRRLRENLPTSRDVDYETWRLSVSEAVIRAMECRV